MASLVPGSQVPNESLAISMRDQRCNFSSTDALIRLLTLFLYYRPKVYNYYWVPGAYPGSLPAKFPVRFFVEAEDGSSQPLAAVEVAHLRVEKLANCQLGLS